MLFFGQNSEQPHWHSEESDFQMNLEEGLKNLACWPQEKPDSFIEKYQRHHERSLLQGWGKEHESIMPRPHVRYWATLPLWQSTAPCSSHSSSAMLHPSAATVLQPQNKSQRNRTASLITFQFTVQCNSWVNPGLCYDSTLLTGTWMSWCSSLLSATLAGTSDRPTVINSREGGEVIKSWVAVGWIAHEHELEYSQELANVIQNTWYALPGLFTPQSVFKLR